MIVGLHGKMGAGKNEAARRTALLMRGKGVPVYEVSFAAPLKASVAALFNVSVTDLEIWKNDPSKVVTVGGLYDGLGFVPLDKAKVLTVRELLQRYGTEAHRDVFGVDFWLDAALPPGKDYQGALYLVTDARFPNEAQRVRDLGGVMVEIVGPRQTTGPHASERPIRCDYVIDNRRRADGFKRLDSQLRALLTSLAPARAA